MLTVFGVLALTFMMLMYALERRGPRFIAAFACGCALSSVYGFLAGTWPFGVVEAIWAAIAARRYVRLRNEQQGASANAAYRGAACPDRSAATIHPATKTNPAEMPKTQAR